MSVTNSKIYKVAGLSLLGFCAVSIGMDRANVGPIATQVGGFCGAFLGALVAQKRKHSTNPPVIEKPEPENVPPADKVPPAVKVPAE